MHVVELFVHGILFAALLLLLQTIKFIGVVIRTHFRVRSDVSAYVLAAYDLLAYALAALLGPHWAVSHLCYGISMGVLALVYVTEVLATMTWRSEGLKPRETAVGYMFGTLLRKAPSDEAETKPGKGFVTLLAMVITSYPLLICVAA